MRRYFISALATLALLPASAGLAQLHFSHGGEPLPEKTPEPTPTPTQSTLPAWLAGTWQKENGAAWADEVWMAPRGDAMIGLTRAGFGKDVDTWAVYRIVSRPDGTIKLIRQEKGGSPVEYAVGVAGNQSLEFTNNTLKPQRIRYWREGQLLMTETSKIDGSEAERSNYRPVFTGPEDR